MRVLVCDDQAVVREGLQALLRREADIEVVALAGNGYDALALALEHQPDLVLMDLKMPGMNGAEATRQIREQAPGIKVLVLTTFEDDAWVIEALRAGAAGYLLKDAPRAELLRAMRGTAAGHTHLDPQVAGALLAQLAHPAPPAPSGLEEGLTPRERMVLRLLARGTANAGIAAQLRLTDGTVRNHISAILLKLGVRDRTQAAVLAVRHGLHELPADGDGA